jgi:2Fe-2S ferredoxin
VYVDPDWVAATGSPEHLEKDMLECAMDLQDNRRLSCQIEVSDELDGLVVRMPELQI